MQMVVGQLTDRCGEGEVKSAVEMVGQDAEAVSGKRGCDAGQKSRASVCLG